MGDAAFESFKIGVSGVAFRHSVLRFDKLILSIMQLRSTSIPEKRHQLQLKTFCMNEILLFEWRARHTSSSEIPTRFLRIEGTGKQKNPHLRKIRRRGVKLDERESSGEISLKIDTGLASPNAAIDRTPETSRQSQTRLTTWILPTG